MTTSNKKLKIYLIAGEPSGDLLGSRLMRALRGKTGSNVEFYGLGGDTMEAEGLAPLFDISDLAIMGLVEVIPSIPKVLRHIRNTVADIVRIQPDIVVTIDSWSFCAFSLLIDLQYEKIRHKERRLRHEEQEQTETI